MLKNINKVKQELYQLEHFSGYVRDHVDHALDIDWLRGQLYLLEEERQLTVQKLQNNLENIRGRRIRYEQARYLLPRANDLNIDERFCHIGHLLADWGFCPRRLLIRYGCTDKDITDWKANKLIVAGQNAYRPSPYAQTTTAVSYYSLTPKGQNYLKKHHFVWNGQLESVYRSALNKNTPPLFKTPAMNMIAPQSFYFEHDIAALTAAVKIKEEQPHLFIFGKALVKAKINHVLGLPIPNSKNAWQYDAIVCALPKTPQDIEHNLCYYTDKISELETRRDARLAEIDQSLEGELNFIRNYPENHYYGCLSRGLNSAEETEKIKRNAQQEKEKILQAYHTALQQKTGRTRQAFIIEYERSRKKQWEMDNFVVKINALAKSDAKALILSTSEQTKNTLKTQYHSRLEAGTTLKWEKRTEHTEHGIKNIWAKKTVKLDSNADVSFLVWDSKSINEVAGFAFRKKKQPQKFQKQKKTTTNAKK